ncbi:MAG TPA: heparinase II/III family protein, partial [Blastocatellia bacterium]|nr:heparinase II/III family protein [Blastocatellia bacterium]
TAIIDGWSPGETYDLFIASHEGYGRLPDPVLHRRWVFHLKSNFWLVRDLALGKRTHQLDIFWHLAPDLVARESGAGGACCFARSEQPLNLLFLTRGDSDLIQELVLGSCSPAYGRQEPGPVLHLSTRTGLPAELSTLLVLTTRALDGNTLTRIRDDRIQATVSAYRYDSLEGRHYMFFCDSSSPWKLADWSSDAQFLYIGLPADSEGTSVILCNGSYASFQDRRMLNCGRSVARYEWSARGQQAFCSDDSALDAFAGEAAARLREALDSTALERK